MSQGDLTVEVPRLRRTDEIGSLTETVRGMVDSLRQQIRRVTETINVLSTSSAAISSTVAQLAVSASKTAASVTETSSTVEQVKQAAKVSIDQARKVAETSLDAVQISEDGKKATQGTAQRMSLIKEQIESIAQTVIKLSDHSRAIEEIISAVQDLADQSNLLAVNASIEAARAGDQGKGFAVVAHEIKSLADQSREATAQIRSILEDTRRWVNAVVMATEQGIKAVDLGMEQSAAAGDCILALAASVAVSSQAAEVIKTFSEQQFGGVDQVAGAMGHIQQATEQSVTGAAQLEDAARKLEAVGLALKQLVEHYKI